MNAAHQRFSHKRIQGGVVLLEALIAILIFSLGILGIVGLQASMIKNASDARYRVDAANIAQQRLGAMWMDQTNLNSYAETGTDISTLLPEGKRTVTVNAATRVVTVTVTWTQPGSSQDHQYETTTQIGGGS